MKLETVANMTQPELTESLEQKLTSLGQLLINQEAAQVAVEPLARESGFWFGGGNIARGPDGAFYLVGRYRNAGDSRTGVVAGTRGLELAIFRSTDRCQSLEKIASFSKQDLSLPEHQVVSIEGCALKFNENGVELYVSTEKDGITLPSRFADYLKPGTGIWTIDCLRAASVEELKSATVTPALASEDPATVHVKDPFVYSRGADDYLLFCTHPFNWTCSCTGYQKVQRSNNSTDSGPAIFDFFPRGIVWDVAMTRGTCVLDVPRIGDFADQDIQLMFYDGGECVRNLEQHAQSVKRPRGYSCEELGGLAYSVNGQLHQQHRLSKYSPLFVSPWGTGCSRYVDIYADEEGMIATWQQSQQDCSQPLVINRVSREEIEKVCR